MSSAPDFLGTVEAWRLWLVTTPPGPPRLASVAYDVTWRPGHPLAATCIRVRRSSTRGPDAAGAIGHHAPAALCSCGIYGLTDAGALLPYVEGRPPPQSVQRVIGRVSLWGAVVECERGWRAANAYPAHLLVPAGRTRRQRTAADALAAALCAYGVPVELVGARAGQRLRRLRPAA